MMEMNEGSFKMVAVNDVFCGWRPYKDEGKKKNAILGCRGVKRRRRCRCGPRLFIRAAADARSKITSKSQLIWRPSSVRMYVHAKTTIDDDDDCDSTPHRFNHHLLKPAVHPLPAGSVTYYLSNNFERWGKHLF